MNARYCLTIGIAALAGSAALSAQTLSYFGRSTIKIVTAENLVIYVDPYASGDYSQKADLVLVTHGHTDHNAVKLVTMKDKGLVAAPAGAVEASTYRAVKEGDEFSLGTIKIRVVPAYNGNHGRGSSVGYVISFDGITVYHAGDTNFIPEMSKLAAMSVDYALLPTDGKWNMGGIEAGRCVDAIKPRFAIAIHSSGDGLYSKANAAKLARPNALPLEPGKTMALTKK